MKLRRGSARSDDDFTKTYRHLHKRHALSLMNSLSAASLGLPIGVDTVYDKDEKESLDTKNIAQTTT